MLFLWRCALFFFSLTLALSERMYVYDLLFVCKVMPFFPFEMSHKKRRESTKTGDDHGFSFLRNHPKELRFYNYLLHAERPRLFLAAYVNVIIIIVVVVVVIINVRKKI